VCGGGQVTKAGIECLGEQIRELGADRGCEDICAKCPVFDHHSITQVAVGSEIRRFLLPLTYLVADGGDDDLVSNIDSAQVNSGEVVRHLEPLWVSGVGLRGRVSSEPLALNTESIAQGTEHGAHCAFGLRNVPFGSAVSPATRLSLGLL
jgi:hypothetical protein